MHVSAVNPASSAPAGPAGLGQGPAAADAGAGFEALLAALIPQQATAAGPVQNGAALALPMDDEAATDAEAAPIDVDVQPAVTDLAANAGPALVVPLAQTTPATPAHADVAPAAWGRAKSPQTPAQPALLNANASADLAAKAGLPPAAEEPAPALSAESADMPPTDGGLGGDRDRKPAELAAEGANPLREPPPAWGREKAPGVPAAPALEHASAQADLTRKLPAVEEAPPRVDAAAPAETPPSAETLAAANGARRPEPAPPPAHEGRAPKSNRDKALSAAGPPTDAPPVDGARPAGLAKAVDAPAKPAATAGEPAEAKLDQAEASSSDGSDLSSQADGRVTGAQGAPSTANAYAVRGGPETVATLAAQIVRKLEGKSTRFDLELDPAGLGKVDVRVEIGPHGRMTAALTCDNPQAAAELRARAPELQRALEQAGFTLSGGLSFDVADGGGGRGQGGQDQPGAAGPSRSQAFRAALDTAADADVAGSLNLRPRRAAGLDLRI